MAPSSNSTAVPDGSSHESKREELDAGLSPSAASAEEGDAVHHEYPDLSVTTQVMLTLTLTLAMMLNVRSFTRANLRPLFAGGKGNADPRHNATDHANPSDHAGTRAYWTRS
jgi:hypothetical protein